MKKKNMHQSYIQTEHKYTLSIALFYCILIVTSMLIIGLKTTRYASSKDYKLYRANKVTHEKEGFDRLHFVSSGQRIIDYQVMEKNYVISYDENDYKNLLKIVESEAGCEDKEGKLLVANVVINRVKSPLFPNNITDVVYQRENGTTQFSPIMNGKFEEAKPSEDTIEIVEMALKGENHSDGALYFAARNYANPDKMQWFDNNLTFLFRHGGHEFFK